MENTEPEFRSRSSGAGVSESEPRSVTSKNGKHGVQNMENTEYKIWKTRSTKYGKHGVQNMENTEYKIWKTQSLTLNMENTECDVKNMEWTYCQREIWKTVSELLCNNTSVL